MTNHDAMLNEGADPPEMEADELRGEQHERCPMCKRDMCLADIEGMGGRENCPCDGEGAAPLMAVDGQAVCSKACLSTWEAGA